MASSTCSYSGSGNTSNLANKNKFQFNANNLICSVRPPHNVGSSAAPVYLTSKRVLRLLFLPLLVPIHVERLDMFVCV